VLDLLRSGSTPVVLDGDDAGVLQEREVVHVTRGEQNLRIRTDLGLRTLIGSCGRSVLWESLHRHRRRFLGLCATLLDRVFWEIILKLFLQCTMNTLTASVCSTDTHRVHTRHAPVAGEVHGALAVHALEAWDAVDVAVVAEGLGLRGVLKRPRARAQEYLHSIILCGINAL